MSDRAAELRALADQLCERPEIADAWTAKSFTDRLLVVDVESDADLPEEVVDELADHGLAGANEVYDVDEGARAFAGGVGDATRHQFVDVKTRGDHQSYVVD